MQVSGTLSAPLDAFLDAPSVTVRNTRNFPLYSYFEQVKYAEIPNYCDVKCLADGIPSLMISQ